MGENTVQGKTGAVRNYDDRKSKIRAGKLTEHCKKAWVFFF